MPKFKQGMAAVVLVVSLGLIVPSLFGGPASADVSSAHDPNGSMDPNYFFDCDLDGNGIYETRYELASMDNAQARHVQGSNLVVMRRVVLDVVRSQYTVFLDPTGTATDFHDPTGYWMDPQGYTVGAKETPKDQPKGWKTVLCESDVPDRYTPNESDVNLGIGFVQSPDCPEKECVTYDVIDTKLYAVTLSEGGQRVSAGRVDDSQSAERAHKAKKSGKHRGNGKRGR